MTNKCKLIINKYTNVGPLKASSKYNQSKHAQINRPTQGELENKVYAKHVQINMFL